jgi:hypothetical protein
MRLVSLSCNSDFDPGVEFEEPNEGRAQTLIKLRYAAPSDPPAGAVVKPAPMVAKTARDLAKEHNLQPWPRQGPAPQKYLELWPDGKKAELARRHVQLIEEIEQSLQV